MPRALLAVNLALRPPVGTDLFQARAFMAPASSAGKMFSQRAK
jgi:hypothetical protein